MSFTMYNEIELEFGSKYTSLQFLSQLKDLESFKSDKKPSSITDLKRLHHNMLMLADTHSKIDELGLNLYSLIDDYKEKKESGGRKFNSKDELEKTVSKMYQEFKETIGVNISYGKQEKKGGIEIINPYNFLSKRIDKKGTVLKEVGDKIVSVKLGSWLMDGFNGSKGLTRKKISEDFEKAIGDDGFKNMLIDKVRRRLFNIQREVKDGERHEHDDSRTDTKLLGFEYKEAYKDLKEMEKDFSKYLDKNKVKAFFDSVKKGGKDKFHEQHKDYARDKEMKELEKENLELKKKLEQLTTSKEHTIETKELSQDLKDIAAELEKDLKDKKEHTIETTELNQDLKGIASTLEKPKQRKRKDDSIDDNGFYRSGKKRGKK